MKLKNEKQLWEDYRFDLKAKEQLVKTYMPAAKRIAARYFFTVKQSIDFNDVLGYAYLGLVVCMNHYNHSRNISFLTFVYKVLPRFIRKNVANSLGGSPETLYKVKRLKKYVKNYEIATNSTLSIAEISNHLQISKNTVWNYLSFDAINFSSTSIDVAEDSVGKCFPQCYGNILDCIETIKPIGMPLTKKELQVVNMYTKDDMTFEAIGNSLGLTKQRIHALWNTAIHKLRAYV